MDLTDLDPDQTRDIDAILKHTIIDPPKRLTQILTNEMRILSRPRSRCWEMSVFRERKLKLVVGEKLRIGGGGIVLKCFESAYTPVSYALKIARPSLYAESDDIDKLIAAEYRHHLPLAHANVAKMFGATRVDIPKSSATTLKVQAWLIEWIDGATPLEKYLHSGIHLSQAIAALRQTFAGIDHLHSKGIVHWDIKSDNLLVSSDRTVKVMDLGNARPLREPNSVYAKPGTANSTFGLNLPPALEKRAASKRKRLVPPPSSNRAPIPLLKGEPTWDRPFLDLYMLATELEPIFKHYNLHKEGVSLEQERLLLNGIQLIMARLRSGDNPRSAAFYESARDVEATLARLIDGGETIAMEELHSVPQSVQRLPGGESAPWTSRVSALANSPLVRRLKRHRQLATVHHVYGGAEHNRWSHAVGTAHTCSRYLQALLDDTSNPFFRMEATKLDLKACLLASVLHDIAHPALGHQLEELPFLPEFGHHEAYVQDVLRVAVGQRQSWTHGARRHAAIARDGQTLKSIVQKYWLDPEDTADRVLQRVLDLLTVEPTEDFRKPEALLDRSSVQTMLSQILRSVFDGHMDADKLDYLRRDALHAGVKYGLSVDDDRMLQSITTITGADSLDDGVDSTQGADKSRCARYSATIGVTDKGILPLESFVVARYQMFSAVYWHHTVRGLTSMLKFACECYLVPPGSKAKTLDAVKLDEMLDVFLEESDDNALAWLQRRLVEEGEAAGGTEKQWIDSAIACCAGLLSDRSRMYRTVLQISSDTEATDSGKGEPISVVAQSWYGDASRTAEDVRRRRELLNRSAEEVQKIFLAEKSVDIDLRYGKLLLDVPEPGKEQVTKLFVRRYDAGLTKVLPLTKLSPVAKAAAATLQSRVRPLRVFVPPKDRAELESAAGSEEAAAELIRTAISKALKVPNLVQLSLWGSAQ